MKTGKTFIISGPSGVGKSTVLRELLRDRDDLYFSISATTRTPREGEIDGVHYHFINVDRFREMIQEDEFLEYAEYVGNFYGTKYLGAIIVAAYSYMALVPIIQPPVIRMVTTKKERLIRMPYEAKEISKTVRILFPIVVTVIAGLIAPRSVSLVGFLMFGNLLRECGVLNSLSETAQNVLANLITIVLGITVATQMQADMFLSWGTLMIMLLGLFAFIFDTVGGVMFAKFLNLFTKKKINPMIGACGISAFPMSSRVVHKMGLKEDPQNFLLMHAAGVNVGGQIASVIAGGLILNLIARV